MIRQAQIAVLTRQIIPLILATHLLFGCDSFTMPSSTASLTDKPLDVNAEGTRMAAFSAALTPLEDIGLRKRKIPEILKMLAENPYTTPATITCDGVKSELADLSIILGPDYDDAKKKQATLSAQEQMMEDGGNILSDAVVGFVRSQTDVIPLRSIVRRLTGASSHEKKVAQAVEAGKLRRAYLKGIAHAKFQYACIAQPQVITATVAPKKDAEAIEIANK